MLANASSTAATTSETAAKTSETKAKTSETNAKASETTAAASVVRALEVAKQSDELLKDINLKLGLAEFGVDNDGNLIYTDNSSYSFYVNSDGDLNWEVA